MPEDDEPKSAVELAMERFRRKDAEEGIAERPLTDEQKQAIAEARSVYAAKLAELEILLRSKLAAAAEPEARETLQQAHQRDVQRAADDRDRKIARIRQGS
jgi:hypothetical protein